MTTWVLISIAALLAVAGLVFFLGKNRQANRLTPLAGLAFAFIIVGLVFGDPQQNWIGYILMGVGVALALADMWRRSRT